MISLTTLLAYALPIIAVTGLGGLVLIYFFFPLVWAALTPIIMRIVDRIISCKRCLYAIALVSACVLSWWIGHYRANAACRAANQLAIEAVRKADADAAKNAAANEGELVKKIEDEARARSAADAEYIEKLEANPDCALTGDDLDGLRNKRRWRVPFTSGGSK